MSLLEIIEAAATGAEVAGVAIILGGALLGVVIAIGKLRHEPPGHAYHRYRRFLGRSILLGLELLVAADIIRTISTVPTLERAVVLAIIVFVRTFLAMALEVELEGRWPWRSPDKQHKGSASEP